MLGGGSITGLGVVRNLGRNGVDVYYVSEQKDEVLFSKYCKKCFIVPSIEHDTDVLRSFLVRLEKQMLRYAVIFPGSDLASLNLAYLRDAGEISDSYHALVASRRAIDTLVDKKKFYQSLDKEKIQHPFTRPVESLADLRRIGKELDYPVYLRPNISPVFTRKFNKKGFVAGSEEELVTYYMLASKSNIDVMIQEIIPGPAGNLFGIGGYFDKESHPQGFFAYRRLREWPHGFGNSTLIESISLSDVRSIRDMALNYLHDLGYYGVMEAEFKKDPRDGNYKFLEVNARSWWQNSFPAKCGINIVLMAYLDAVGKGIEHVDKYETGIKWINIYNDLLSSMKLLREGKMTARKWLYSLRAVSDEAYFSRDDVLPWMASHIFLLRSASYYLRKH